MSEETQRPDFEAVKNRLAEIAEAVDDESLSLDDALDLYEEAVALGLKASDLLETGVVVPEDPADSAEEHSSALGSPQANEGDMAAESAPQPETASN